MSEADSKSRNKGETGLTNQDITTNTTTLGLFIDTNRFESITHYIQSGTLTAGDFAFELEESDDGSTGITTVPADNTIGLLTGFVAADDDTVKSVGSIGKKQFQRINIVSTGVSGSNLFSGISILGHPKVAPTAD